MPWEDMPPELRHYDIASVDRAEVLRYLGYRGQSLTDELDARLDNGIARCLELCQPAGVVRPFRIVGRDGGEIALEASALRLKGESIARHLDGALAVALLCVTLGLASERELARLALVNPLDQLVFDAAGSALVERAADAAEARVVELAANLGLYTNDRFAPGYGDLSLDVQEPLLDTLNAQRLMGVSLTPSHMLVPTKSETAVIGLFDSPPARREGGLCPECAMRDFCQLRSRGQSCRPPAGSGS